MTATVEVRLISKDLAGTMRQMRMWLDHHKITPHAFREFRCPGGIALRVEFAREAEASDFAAHFAGKISGTPPSYLEEPSVPLPRD